LLIYVNEMTAIAATADIQMRSCGFLLAIIDAQDSVEREQAKEAIQDTAY
jgi:hypothetical protein